MSLWHTINKRKTNNGCLPVPKNIEDNNAPTAAVAKAMRKDAMRSLWCRLLWLQLEKCWMTSTFNIFKHIASWNIWLETSGSWNSECYQHILRISVRISSSWRSHSGGKKLASEAWGESSSGCLEWKGMMLLVAGSLLVVASSKVKHQSSDIKLSSVL